MPNNDLDAVGGDPRRIAEVRTATKFFAPKLFDAGVPFVYAWSLGEDPESGLQAQAVCVLANGLCQFGRGIDMAWAWGESIGDEECGDRLSSYPGVVYRPSRGTNVSTLSCPVPGSLKSLSARYAANSERFKIEREAKSARLLFSQPPKARFAEVAYDSPPSRSMYELRNGSSESEFAPWPLAEASKLVVWLRDAAASRLRLAQPDRRADIERALIGRKADGRDDGPSSDRVRIVPLPSIGQQHADHGIRRVLVEAPATCLLRPDDVRWAFSGQEQVDVDSGVIDRVLTASADQGMLRHFGVGERARARVWRTMTPAALPGFARRRRIDPGHVAEEAKGGAERAAEEEMAAGAVVQALRHAEVQAEAETIRLQREPFDAGGQRAEAFAVQPRFSKERLWHVQIAFREPIAGPLVIGDGRFLGLGVMAPVRVSHGVHTLVVESGLAATASLVQVSRALRRAVMARVQVALGLHEALPTFFSGHEPDGSAGRTDHQQLTYLFDPGGPRLLVVAPHVIERRTPTSEETQWLRDLDAALVDFRELRAGSAGCLTLATTIIDEDADPLFALSPAWESVTPYQVTRHAKGVGAAEALSGDLRAECRRAGLPEPHVTTRDLHGIAGVGLCGNATLTFYVAVQGPIVLGRSRHFGGGLFVGTGKPSSRALR